MTLSKLLKEFDNLVESFGYNFTDMQREQTESFLTQALIEQREEDLKIVYKVIDEQTGMLGMIDMYANTLKECMKKQLSKEDTK